MEYGMDPWILEAQATFAASLQSQGEACRKLVEAGKQGDQVGRTGVTRCDEHASKPVAAKEWDDQV
eukprot:1157732-Pelagomonas_calceolata.AAC.13